jgi:hypothetical protein
MNTNKRLPFTAILLGISIILSSCLSPTAAPTTQVIPTDTPVFTPTSDSPITNEEAVELMGLLGYSSGESYQNAVERILTVEDTRFIPVLIELMRVYQIGLLPGSNYQTTIDTLETLSGQQIGDNWPAWIEWYGTTDYSPPPGFTSWKGQVLSVIDPGFGEFLQDDLPSTIRVEEILWGGVAVDGIPALDNPTMIAASEADYLEPDEPVFGLSINGDHRAYPLRILDWHEMANDVVGGVPVSLAYCTLCGAGIAYDGRGSDGEVYTFGSSGFLYRSNKLMYDRQTRTLWNQLTGEPVLGNLVGSDPKLELLPVVVTTWETWLSRYPDTLVLDLETGYQRPYNPGAAYGDYFAYDQTMFPVWQRSDLLDTKDRIYALRVEGIPKAYPLDILFEEVVVNDTIGETAIVLIASQGEIIVDGYNQRVGEVSYSAGGEVRAYARQDETFSPGEEVNTVLDSQGHVWQVTEEALVGPNGEIVERVSGHLAYWFGWFSFFPKTLLYEK